VNDTPTGIGIAPDCLESKDIEMLTCPHCGKEIATPRKPYKGAYKDFVPLIVDLAGKGWRSYDIALEILKRRPDSRCNARELVQQSVYNIARINGIKVAVPQPSTSSRNLEIVGQHAAGMTFKAIGEIHGIAPNRARQIVMQAKRAAMFAPR